MHEDNENDVTDVIVVEAVPDEEVERAIDHYTVLRENIQNQLLDQRISPQIKDAIFLLPDLFMLLLRLIGDRRVEVKMKLELMLAVTYVITPFDLIPDFLPGLGWLDDVLAITLVLTRIISVSKKANAAILEEYWDGNQDVLLVLQDVSTSVSEALERLGLFNAILKQLQRLGK